MTLVSAVVRASSHLQEPFKVWSHPLLTLLADTLHSLSSIAGHGRNVKAVQDELENLIECIGMFVYPLRQLSHQPQGDATNGIMSVGRYR